MNPAALRRSLPFSAAIVLAAALLPATDSTAAQPRTEQEILLSTLSTAGVAHYKEALAPSRMAEMNRYDISVSLDPEGRTLSGRVEMNVRNTSSATLTEAILRLWPNSMVKGERPMTLLETKAGRVPAEFKMTAGSIVSVKLPAPVRPGERFTLEARFSATIPSISSDSLNLYAQAVEQLFRMLTDKNTKPASADYGLFATDGKVFNLGGFYPVPATLGRNGWEAEESNGIGDFSYGPPSNYFVEIKTPAGYIVAAPGREIGKTDKDGRVTRYMAAGAVRDYVIEASKAFETVSETVDGTDVTAYFPKESEEGARRMLQVAKDTLIFYSKKFGPYPYREFKAVVAPITGGAGGVEFPGLVTIAGMLMSPPSVGEGKGEGMDFGSMAAASSLTAELLDFVVAHEVAHQWWSALVGSDPRKHPYVDEGLASYSSVMYFEEIYGKPKGKHILDTQVRMNYQMMRLFGGADRPIETPVSQYGSMIDYAGIVYGKAPFYHHAIRGLLGGKAWFETCTEYALKFGFRTAVPGSFLSTATGLFPQYDNRLADLDRRWMKETHGDEDMGKADLFAVLEMATGRKLDGDVKEFIEEMFPMMKQYR